MMKKHIQNALVLAILASTTSACIPKKFEVGLSTGTLSAVNQLGTDLKDATSGIKGKLAEAQDLVKAKNGIVNAAEATKVIQSIRDFSRSELGSKIITSEEVRALTKVIETAQAVECYSDAKEYLKYKKVADQSYDFKLSLVCFDTQSLPQVAGADSLAEDSKVMIPGVSVIALGNATWSQDDGLKVIPAEGTTPSIQTESYSIYTVKAAQENLIRVVPSDL